MKWTILEMLVDSHLQKKFSTRFTTWISMNMKHGELAALPEDLTGMPSKLKSQLYILELIKIANILLLT